MRWLLLVTALLVAGTQKPAAPPVPRRSLHSQPPSLPAGATRHCLTQIHFSQPCERVAVPEELPGAEAYRCNQVLVVVRCEAAVGEREQ